MYKPSIQAIAPTEPSLKQREQANLYRFEQRAAAWENSHIEIPVRQGTPMPGGRLISSVPKLRIKFNV